MYDRRRGPGYACSAVRTQAVDVLEALPPVENQSREGSCTAFATAYYGLHMLIKWREITGTRDQLKANAPRR